MLYDIIFGCCAYILVMETKMYYGMVKKTHIEGEDSILHTPNCNMRSPASCMLKGYIMEKAF
jgi:hypothetical protein